MRPTSEARALEEQSYSVRRVYEYAQPPAPVAVREYLLTRLEGERCCLLHWLLREDIRLDRMSFTLIQLDENGEELASSEITHEAGELPTVESGHLFAPPRAIPILPRCATVRVRLRELVSDVYLYRMTPTGVTVDYIADTAWVYDKKAPKKDKLKRRIPLRVTSKLGRRVRGVWPVALLGLLLVAWVISWPYLERVINWPLVERVVDNFFDMLGRSIENFFEMLGDRIGEFLANLFSRD